MEIASKFIPNLIFPFQSYLKYLRYKFLLIWINKQLLAKIYKNNSCGIMMHYSHMVYENQESRKNKHKNKDRNPAKSNGSYFEAPLVEKTLSTKPHSFRNVFRCIVEEHENQQFLDLTPMQSTTMKTMNIQKLSDNPQVRKAFRRHYRIDIKNYLKRKYRKQAYQMPLEAFQLLRFVDVKQDPFKTNFIYIYKPFYLNDNLKRRIESDFEWSNEIFKYKSLPKIFRQLLKCSVEFGGLDNFIMTTSNVYLEENLQTLQINYTSFTGLALLKCHYKIGAHQYFEVMPYFTENMINTGNIGYQQRIRFFLINCLCALTKRDFVLEAQQQVEADYVFPFDAVKNKLKQKTKIAQQFQKHLGYMKGKNKKKMAQDLKITELIRKGLVRGEPLTWEEIVKCICVGQEVSPEGVKPNQQYGKKIQEVFKKLHKDLLESDPDRKFYEERNLDSELLYIPVKYQADLALVFEKKAWWQAFNIKDEKGDLNNRLYNIFHENFCFRLLDATISHYYRKVDKEDDWVEKFKEDQVIEILFEYLNVCQYPSMIIMNQGQENEMPVQFNEIYNKYVSLKQMASKVK